MVTTWSLRLQLEMLEFHCLSHWSLAHSRTHIRPWAAGAGFALYVMQTL